MIINSYGIFIVVIVGELTVVAARLFGRRMFQMWIFWLSYSLPVTNVSFGSLVPIWSPGTGRSPVCSTSGAQLSVAATLQCDSIKGHLFHYAPHFVH